jgi:hypothetical protein
MRISELIAKLQEAMTKHGDLRVEIPTDFQLGDGYPIEAESVEFQAPQPSRGIQSGSVIIV